MEYSCKVGGEPERPVLIYYKKGNFVNGKLKYRNGAAYFYGDDHGYYPVCINGKGDCITVISSYRDINDDQE